MKKFVGFVLIFVVFQRNQAEFINQQGEVKSTSCQDRCGEEFDLSNDCHCTADCGFYGNCCEDYIDVCANANKCKNRCGERYSSTNLCHCNSDCLEFGTCCDDFKDVCIASCVNRCNEESNPPNYACRCEGSCLQYENCCPDFDNECLDSSTSTCEKRCFLSYNPNAVCQCNAGCKQYGNCCEDFIELCTNSSSCSYRCGEDYSIENPCQCDSTCSFANNCCDDFNDVCEGSCENRCGESNPPENFACRCDDTCESFGNCCPDYDNFCITEYLCKGECNVVRERCSCMPDCVNTKTCCSDYLQSCEDGKAWTEDECADESEMVCPEDFEIPPVILFSLDGFRSEYLYRNLTPNVWKVANCGVHAKYMRAVFPTKTFPNHYTITSGLYPESHGIIDNTMFDHEFGAQFSLGSDESSNPRWWGGKPIWVSTSEQEKLSACYFWPGSDVEIIRYPDYYKEFNSSVPNEERMYQALEWLDLPKDKRPSFMTLYIQIIDDAGHDGGPNSSDVNFALARTDNYIKILMDGLKLRKLENCVNIMIVADHGMTSTSCDRKVSVENYGVNTKDLYVRAGPFGRIGKSGNPALWEIFDAEEIHNKLRCTHKDSHWLSYLKYRYLPKRYHYAYNNRIEPVILAVDDEWLVEGKKGSYTYCDGGTHGYDNEFASMHSLFSAHGPGFKRQHFTEEPFENIELYNLMTDLLNIEPEPNNGTAGALYNLMASPPSINIPEKNVPACPISENATIDETCLFCNNDSDDEINSRLELSEDEISTSINKNAPFGIPVVDEDICRLTHVDFLNIFNYEKKISHFVSFTLQNKEFDLLAPADCLRPDPRISLTSKCNQYFEDRNVNPVALYPLELSDITAFYEAGIMSNRVPMYPAAEKIWKYMAKSMALWSEKYNGVHIIAGPIYDYNFDGIADSLEILQESDQYLNQNQNNTPIPTHFFVIALRCKAFGITSAECKESLDNMDVLSFIIPNYEIEPCHTEEEKDSDWIPPTLKEHVARVRDIELLTGITFFPNLYKTEDSSVIRLKLRLPQFRSDWMLDFLNDVPRELGIGNGNAATTVLTNKTIQMFLAIFWTFIFTKL